MSIVGSNPTQLLNALATIGVIITFTLSATLIVRLDVFRPSRVVGPNRIDRTNAPWLIMSMAGGYVVWLGVQLAYYNAQGSRMVDPAGHFDVEKLTIKDWSFLATVPYLVGFAAMWTTDCLFGGFDLLRQLGFSLHKAFVGIGRGLVAAIVILPLTYLVVDYIEWLYKRIHFEHPKEHELLKVMRQSPSHASQLLFILSATLLAPLFEEFLFRGHLQTLLKRWFITSTTGDIVPLGSTDFPRGSTVILPDVPLRKAPVWQTWLAIVVTSILFALVHDRWMWPPIFFLSLGLGYCYERTGNLWANMVVHCLFNSVSTFTYLYISNT